MSKKEKTTTRITDDDKAPDPKGDALFLSDDWNLALYNIVLSEQGNKPERLYTRFVQYVRSNWNIDTDELLEKKQLKKKISAMKSSIKSKVQKSII